MIISQGSVSKITYTVKSYCSRLKKKQSYFGIPRETLSQSSPTVIENILFVVWVVPEFSSVTILWCRFCSLGNRQPAASTAGWNRGRSARKNTWRWRWTGLNRVPDSDRGSAQTGLPHAVDYRQGPRIMQNGLTHRGRVMHIYVNKLVNHRFK